MKNQCDMNNNIVLLSIRCFVYNHEAYLRQCLDGFVMQKTNFAFEAIVHDDASTDGSANIIREYAEKYPDIIKPIYETENQYSKHDGSLRRIMDSAISPSSKYLAICEGDDYWTDPYKLQKQVDYMESHPNCTMVCCKAANYSELNHRVTSYTSSNHKTTSLSPKRIILEGGYYIATCGIVYRKDLMNVYPEYCRRCHVGDYPLQIFASMVGDVFYFNEAMVVYRVDNVGSWSSSISKHNDSVMLINKIKSEIDMLQGIALDYPQYNNIIKRRIAHYLNWQVWDDDRFNSMLLDTFHEEIQHYNIIEKLHLKTRFIKIRVIRSGFNYLVNKLYKCYSSCY